MSGSGVRFRCCGRYCYWRIPLGPWQCTRCDRTFNGGDVPKAAEGRFWEGIQALIEKSKTAKLPPGSGDHLLPLFFLE
jgi:hypothetical protein